VTKAFCLSCSNPERRQSACV